MDNLTVIDNELVPVYLTDNGAKIVDGRELHAVLQSKQDFSTWVKRRLNECDAVENKDYSTAPQIYGTGNGGHSTRLEYTILLDTAKEMAMLERNAKGKQVRRYFIKVDEKYKEEKSTPLTLQQQIQTIAQGTDELYQRVEGVESEVSTVKAEIEALRDELPLFPSEAEKISNAAKRKGVEVLGGKQSNAYKNGSLQHKVYTNIYANLKYNFGVSSYKSIKRGKRKEALRIVEEYKPPYFLAEQIEMENAQQILNV